ncbi:Hypothetical protein Cp262_2169 [Corynebacterium pseudotuberculosis]|nr:Hypothetical protein Cp262_2169 [Corynebacterium pseudotuberculosis]
MHVLNYEQFPRRLRLNVSEQITVPAVPRLAICQDRAGTHALVQQFVANLADFTVIQARQGTS